MVYNLREFTNKKVYSMAVGDHHIIVSASEANFEDLPGQTAKVEENKNFMPKKKVSDVYAWGYNYHGQVDCIPSETSITRPKIIPFF
jgi:alpha-tubulin suppressor-like RCC1 family protein